MLEGIEVIVKPDGNVQWKEPLKMKTPRRAIVTFLEEEPAKDEIKPAFDFHNLIGIALKGPGNPNRRFKNEDELWE